MSRLPTPKQLAAYVRRCADAMRLETWRFSVALHDGLLGADNDEENDAETYFPGDVRVAEITFASTVFAQSAAEQRAVVAHELTHLHFRKFSQLAEWLNKSMGGSLGDFSTRMCEAFEEEAVDELALLIAPTLPLPPWTTP